MSEVVVLCGGVEADKGDEATALRLKLDGDDTNISLRIEDISRRMLAELPAVLTDLLEVATYVYCADQLVSRGGNVMQALGADWRRRLRFIVPVRECGLWSSPEVKESLERLLAFMSDEEFRFDFVPALSPTSIDRYFDFSDQDGSTVAVEEVLLLSGGLDSLAGAVDRLEHGQSRLLLVSHQSSPKAARHQKDLVEQLGDRCPGRVLHVPVRISKHGLRAVEITQRTRSFLFAALGLTVGRLAAGGRISIFENGVLSFNLPIAAQVVGARATRSTHPRVLRDLQQFFSLLLGEEIRVDNPFVWKTKTEVVKLLEEAGHADLVPLSLSCSHIHGTTVLRSHCGRCSQCLDRRFATLAAGLGEVDPEEMYDVDLLTGPRGNGDDRVMAESFVRHAREFLRLTDMGFLGRFGGHVARASAAFDDLTAEQVMRHAIDLHRRHGESVVSALNEGFRRHARELAEGTLVDDCLLRIVGGPHGQVREAPIRDPTERPAGGEPEDDSRDYWRTSEIRLALEPTRSEVLVDGIPPVKGKAGFGLVSELVATHEQDRSNRLAPENYRYLSTTKITSSLGIEEMSLRRRVSRFRKTVAEEFEQRYGLPLSKDAIIESRKWQGYRLNPDVRIVAADQLDPKFSVTFDPAQCHDSRT